MVTMNKVGSQERLSPFDAIKTTQKQEQFQSQQQGMQQVQTQELNITLQEREIT